VRTVRARPREFALNYVSLLLAVLAAAVVIFLIKRSGKSDDPPARVPPNSIPTQAPAPSRPATMTPDSAPVREGPRAIVRVVSPQIEAMLADFKLARSAELTRNDAQAIMAMLDRIPRPPSALHKLVSPEFLVKANTAELSEMVIAEPQIAAKVLVVVNSPFYGLKAPLGSIGQAVTFLGMNTVRSICLQYLLDESFQSKDPEVKRIFDGLWNASAFASELCFKLAQLLQLPEPGALVTQVVLSFLGHVASHSLLRKDLVVAMMSKGLLERSRVEQDHLGLCAAEIGSLLMQKWELPQSIIDRVRDIDQVLLSPYNQALGQRNTNMAFCYFCARMGEKLAYGSVKDLAAFQLEQEQSPEFFHLQSYLQRPDIARLNEYLHMPEVVSSINTMVQSMQIRR
jgi:HD-like signal output (HDOD) protein